MSRKDYVLLAAALRRERPTGAPDGEAFGMWRASVLAVASALASDSHRFDRDRFLRAAGLED